MAIPSDLANLLFWRDANNAYTDAGSTPATTVGDLVQQFTDRSGNGWHMTQATSGSRGDIQMQAGVKCVRFNNAHFYNMGDMFNTAGTPATAGEWFWLLRVPGIRVNGSHITSGTSYGGGDSLYGYSNGLIYDKTLSTLRQDSIAGLPYGFWHTYSVRSKAGRWSAFINGEMVRDNASNVFSPPPAAIFGKNDIGNFWIGYLHTDFGFTRELSDAERLSMHEYMLNSLPSPDLQIYQMGAQGVLEVYNDLRIYQMGVQAILETPNLLRTCRSQIIG